jgi:hypothetical protein
MLVEIWDADGRVFFFFGDLSLVIERMLGFLFLFKGKLIIFNVRVSCLLNKK